eukprot:2419327-Pleurochrysis_carterae.AAC.1
MPPCRPHSQLYRMRWLSLGCNSGGTLGCQHESRPCKIVHEKSNLSSGKCQHTLRTEGDLWDENGGEVKWFRGDDDSFKNSVVPNQDYKKASAIAEATVSIQVAHEHDGH